MPTRLRQLESFDMMLLMLLFVAINKQIKEEGKKLVRYSFAKKKLIKFLKKIFVLTFPTATAKKEDLKMTRKKEKNIGCHRHCLNGKLFSSVRFHFKVAEKKSFEQKEDLLFQTILLFA